MARDDEQLPKTGERCDDLLHHTISKVVLSRVAAHVLKWQHRDRRHIWKRQAGLDHRCGVAFQRLLLAYVRDEADPLAGKRLDRPLLGPAVANRGSGGIDAGHQRRFGDDPPSPDTRDQVVLADNALSIADQVLQEIENLGLEGNCVGSATEFASFRVEDAIVEEVQQVTSASGLCSRSSSAAPYRVKNQGNDNAKLSFCESAAARVRPFLLIWRSSVCVRSSGCCRPCCSLPSASGLKSDKLWPWQDRQ